MAANNFPPLDPNTLAETRDACHAYSQVLGQWARACRPKRKHWWHMSLRPSLTGVTTGVIDAGSEHFELGLDLAENRAWGKLAKGLSWQQPLGEQSAAELAVAVGDFLVAGGIEQRFVPAAGEQGKHCAMDGHARPGYSAEIAGHIGHALREITAALAAFRSGIREETSPINFWPGHFDLSMLWLPGEIIAGADPGDEESADKQLNFGFSFGDGALPEPYFYITAYPQPEAFPGLKPIGDAYWHSQGFNGVVLPYSNLVSHQDPTGALLALWQWVLDKGRTHMLDTAEV